MLYQGYTLDPNVVDKLQQQITNQRNNVSFADGKTLGNYWTGGVDRDWATEEMAKMLASSGVTSIDQVGLVKKASPYYGVLVQPIYETPARTEITGYYYEGDSGNPMPITQHFPASGPIVAYTATLNQPTYDEYGYQTNPGEYIQLTPQELSTISEGERAILQSGSPQYVRSLTRYVDAVGNKTTGQPLLPWDHARGGLNDTTWGSTTAGKDNSYFKVAFDQNTGLPLFYTAPKRKGDAFSQFTSMLKQAAPALSIAMMAVPGVGQALGSTLLGAVGATELAANAAIAAAVGSAVVTTVLTGSPKAGINSAIGSYVGQGIASQLGDLATSAAGKQLVESMSSAATRSLITGRNSGEILQDTIAAGIGSAGRLLLESSPWGSTSGLSNETKAALSTAVSTALQGEGNLSEKLSKAAQEGAITYGLSQLNTGGITISPTTQNILNKTLGAALSGKPITPALVSAAVSSVNTELNGVLSKKAELEKHITSGAAQHIINTAMNSASAFWTGEFDSVNTYLNQAIAVANQISQTVARVQGVDVNRADRVQVTNLLNQSDPLRATYNYAVNNDPSFVTNAAKRFDADAAAGRSPDYGAMDLLIKDLSRYDEVKRLNPDFNADDYKAINQLSVNNPYEHYLTTGRKEGLIGSKIENTWRTSLEKSRLVGEAAQLIGVGVNELSPETRQAISTAIDQKFADPRDFKEMAETSLRNWDDVAGLKLAPARLATLKSGEGMRIEVYGARWAIDSFEYGESGPDGKPIIKDRNPADVQKEVDAANQELKNVFGTEFAKQYRIGTTADIAAGNGRWIQRTAVNPDDQKSTSYIVAVVPNEEFEAIPQDNLARIDALVNAPASYFDGDAQLRDYFKGIVDKAKGAALKTPAVQLLQFAGNAIETMVPDTAKGVGMKAVANVIQSFNGLVTMAGINPSSTPVGKFAERLMELGKAKTSDEYRAAVAAMEKNYGDAKGAGGAAKAIWGNVKNYPIEFLSEVVISEGLQEFVPLLIGGGATVAARGLALARGMGTKLAQQMGARAGLAAGAISDIAESVGGSAGNAFEEAYDIAKNKMGKSEAEATEIALGVAARSGMVSGVVTGLSLGLGGGALEKALLGTSGKGNLASAIDEIGSRMKDGVKIVGKEGLSEGIEEGLTGAYTESQLYQLDPTRDVGANIATSALLGAIAGGGIAGGAYAGSTSRDVIANVLSANPQVQQTIQSAPNIAEAQKALGDLGISNAAVQTDLLNNKFDGQIVSSNEAYSALRNNTGYNPTDADVAALSGVRSESNLQNDALQYIDPRMVDEAEVRQAMQALGYSAPTEQEVAQYLGQRDEASTLGDVTRTFDPQAVDAGEAEAALRVAGYTPTQQDIASFVGAKPEAELAGDVQRFVDPRQVTEAEVRKAFEDLGYAPTKEEIAQYVRAPGATVSQTDIEKQIGAYADPMAVDKVEAKAALEAAGLKNPTDEEINRLVGQYPEADLAGKTKDLSDTLQIERVAKDIADVQAKIGAPNTVPTADDVLRAQRIAVGMVPGVGRTSDAPGFDKNYDVTGDGRITSADALKLSKMSKGMDVGPLPEGLKWEAPTGLYKRMFDVEAAVKNIQFPDTLSEEDVRNIVDDAFDKNPGLTESDVTRVVNDALTKLPAAPTKQDVLEAVNEGIGARSVADDPSTPENEAKEATGLYRDIERLEFALNNIEFPPSLTEEQVREIVQGAFDANPGLSDQDVTNAIDAALDKLPAAPTLAEINTAVAGQIGARSVKDDPSTPQDESKEATGIYREIERIEQAIEGIEIPPSLTEQQVKDIVAGVFEENPGLSPEDVKGIVNTALDALPVAPTLAEISQEVDGIVGAPSVKDDPTTPENEAREATGVYRAIEATAAGVESRLGAAIADAKAAGLEGDAALDAAIKKVASQLGTSETTLLAKIGKTAEDLSKDFAAQLETVTGQITTVEQAIGKPASVDAQGNKIPATGIYAEIAKNEAAGMTRDAATQKAIADLSKQLGASETAVKAALTATETALGGRITTVEQAIGAPASVDANGNPVPATGIFAEIAKNEAAGMSRDAATQKAITDLSGQLGVAQETILGELSKAETRFGTALAGVQTAVTGQIAAAQNQIMERMAVYEQAGIDRDTALNLAIQDVSSKLGGQITDLSQLVGKPTTMATQGDIDAINQMIAGTKPMDLSYDITGDKTVDAKDIDALQRWLAATDTEQFPPGTQPPLPEGIEFGKGSRWAPTGLYGELADATRAQQATAKAQTEQVLRGQRQANVMQMLGLIGQEPAGGAQQVTVKAPDPAKIGYIYDWSSIFANPQQQQMFASPFAEGGEVADTDELIAILRGSHG
jgi:hypothetical protein